MTQHAISLTDYSRALTTPVADQLSLLPTQQFLHPEPAFPTKQAHSASTFWIIDEHKLRGRNKGGFGKAGAMALASFTCVTSSLVSTPSQELHFQPLQSHASLTKFLLPTWCAEASLTPRVD